MRKADEHRWSGWPGAFCLNCGVEDPLEQCIADHNVSITCVHGHVQCEEAHEMQRCTEHVVEPCTMGGMAKWLIAVSKDRSEKMLTTRENFDKNENLRKDTDGEPLEVVEEFESDTHDARCRFKLYQEGEKG